MLKRFLLIWAANVIGLFTAALLFSAVDYSGRITVLLIASLIFAIVNSLIRPLVVIISLPAIVLTLGLFTLVVNAAMLYLTSHLYPALQLRSVWATIGTVIIVWLVNYIFDIYMYKEKTL